MTEKENRDNSEMLTFEELREKLGMNEPVSEKKKRRYSGKVEPLTDAPPKSDMANADITAELQKVLSQKEVPEAPVTVKAEDNGEFVDITDKYITDRKRSVDSPVEIIPQRKQIRTFNQIFSDFFKWFIPLKKDRTREKLRKIVMDLAIVAVVASVIAFGELYRQHKVQLKTEQELKNSIVVTDTMSENEYSAAWETLFKKYPNLDFPVGMNLKYAYLYAVNQELVGWLKIPGTSLDVQLVQSEDDSTYLNKNFYKKTSRYGTPYIDSRNDAKYLNDNTIIYGHHMSDGLMFSNLDKYTTLEGYKASPIIQLDTLYDTYYFKVFAAFITNSDEKDDNGYVFNYTVTSFSNDKMLNDFVTNVKQRSIFNTGITVQPDDKLLTLVTCSYEFNEARLVVMARMVRDNEEISVDTADAVINSSPRYPQGWYDAKGIDNPYADAEKWTP